jgi:hypothetical protein
VDEMIVFTGTVKSTFYHDKEDQPAGIMFFLSYEGSPPGYPALARPVLDQGKAKVI